MLFQCTLAKEMLREVDYEDVEDQAVMFDIINMVEANDLWNEVMFELIARGDAVRRADGKIIFTDQAPQYVAVGNSGRLLAALIASTILYYSQSTSGP